MLDSVSGLDCYYGMNINIPGIILGVLLALCSFMLFGAGSQMIFPGLIVLALGVLLVVSSFQKSFCLSVYSSKANGSPITVGTGPQDPGRQRRPLHPGQRPYPRHGPDAG